MAVSRSDGKMALGWRRLPPVAESIVSPLTIYGAIIYGDMTVSDPHDLPPTPLRGLLTSP